MATSVAGRVLISSSSALLLCLFLSPRFIDFLRSRAFGQNIREEGPEGHKQKAGTPTMGGIIIIIAFAVPFLFLSTRNWRVDWRLRRDGARCALLGFADDYTKIVRRRSLGLRARTKLSCTLAISIGLWWIATKGRRARVVGRAADRRRARRPRAVLLRAHLPRRRRHDQRVNLTDGLDGLAAGCAAIVAARLHRRSRSSPTRRARPRRCSPAASSAPASASCGSTLPGVDLHGRHRLARRSAARSPRWR